MFKAEKEPNQRKPTGSVPPPWPGSVATRRTTIYKIWCYVALKRAVTVTCGAIWQMPHLAHPLRTLCCRQYIWRFLPPNVDFFTSIEGLALNL